MKQKESSAALNHALSIQRQSFIDDAEKAAAEVDAGGPVYSAEHVHAYILGRAAGHSVMRPLPRRRKG